MPPDKGAPMSLSIQLPEPGGNGLREAFTRPMTTLFRRSTAPISPPDGSKCPATLMSTGCDTAERLVRVNPAMLRDRKSVVEGKSVSVRVDLGGRGIIKKKTMTYYHKNATTNTKNYKQR